MGSGPRTIILAVALSCITHVAVVAQARGEMAGFIIRLGGDTIAVEQYRRSATALESEIAVRVPFARRVHFIAALDSTGRMTRFDLTIRPLNHNAGPPATGAMVFKGDSADLTLTLDDSTRTLRIAARPGAVPLSAFSASLVEQAILQAYGEKRDSVAFDWLALGSPRASPSYVVRRGKDSVVVGFFGDPLYGRVDRHGRLLGLDGRETTQKVMVTRVREVNVGAFATAFAQAEASRGPAGQLSPRDTVKAEVAGAHLVVDYGRPWKRGRTIFGGVVPWSRVWRAGANAATQFTTDANLHVEHQVIPAGSYTLWVLPEPTGAKLIVNRQTGQWGTEYDASKDLLRLDLLRDTLPVPLDEFTIAIAPRDSGGVLTLSWDATAYALPFTVAR
ncbi:MAG: DUF2911 domain-containing protein [Gemmatimonadales bacterium]